jgi:hypothetical protein
VDVMKALEEVAEFVREKKIQIELTDKQSSALLSAIHGAQDEEPDGYTSRALSQVEDKIRRARRSRQDRSPSA